MPEWTFITNHAALLSVIARNPRVTARELAGAVGITERAVRKIIADLQAAGYLRKKREGRRVRYSISLDKQLRHQTHGERTIGELLSILKDS